MVKRKREEKVENLVIKLLDEISFIDGKRSYKSVEINGIRYSVSTFILTRSRENNDPDVRMITRIFQKRNKIFLMGYWLRPAYGIL